MIVLTSGKTPTRHPHLQAGESRVREAAIVRAAQRNRRLNRPPLFWARNGFLGQNGFIGQSRFSVLTAHRPGKP